jgi:hypothetical protein
VPTNLDLVGCLIGRSVPLQLVIGGHASTPCEEEAAVVYQSFLAIKG